MCVNMWERDRLRWNWLGWDAELQKGALPCDHPPVGTEGAGQRVPPAESCGVPGLLRAQGVARSPDVHDYSILLSPGARIPGSPSHWKCSFHSNCTSQWQFFVFFFLFLICFPSSFSAAVINSNTPSLKCQSKLHQALRTIVCLYAQSINLNYQVSHYMPTIKQWHTHRLYSTLK